METRDELQERRARRFLKNILRGNPFVAVIEVDGVLKVYTSCGADPELLSEAQELLTDLVG